ncbi:hypothetical protein GCM10009634_27370 [Saccharothrix xinjiangensis]
MLYALTAIPLITNSFMSSVVVSTGHLPIQFVYRQVDNEATCLSSSRLTNMWLGSEGCALGAHIGRADTTYNLGQLLDRNSTDCRHRAGRKGFLFHRRFGGLKPLCGNAFAATVEA